jgi:hypothetical protein
MATRLWFSSTYQATLEVDPSEGFGWDNSSQFVRAALISQEERELIPATDTQALVQAPLTWTPGSPGERWLHRQWVSRPLAAQNITGELLAQMMFSQGDLGMALENITSEVYLVDSDGNWKTTIVDSDFAGTFGLYPAATNIYWMDESGLDIDVDEGDRIVVELGFSDSGGTPPYTGYATIGTDQSNGDLDTFGSEVAPPLKTAWMEFSQDLEFLDLPQVFLDAEFESGSTMTAALNDSAQVKYNIYTAPDAFGPWTKVNALPINNNADGNEYDITDLQNGQLYYIMVVAGRLDEENNFLALCGQAISNDPEPGSNVANPHLILARPKRVSNTATSILGMQSDLLEVGEL